MALFAASQGSAIRCLRLAWRHGKAAKLFRLNRIFYSVGAFRQHQRPAQTLRIGRRVRSSSKVHAKAPGSSGVWIANSFPAPVWHGVTADA